MVLSLVAWFLFRHFRGDEGLKKNVTVKAFLSYWLSRYVLSSSLKDGINVYVFPFAVRLARGKKLPLGPLCLGSLYTCLDECIRNITPGMGRYDVVTYVDSAFFSSSFGSALEA